jgi:hypothetical protein
MKLALLVLSTILTVAPACKKPDGEKPSLSPTAGAGSGSAAMVGSAAAGSGDTTGSATVSSGSSASSNNAGVTDNVDHRASIAPVTRASASHVGWSSLLAINRTTSLRSSDT